MEKSNTISNMTNNDLLIENDSDNKKNIFQKFTSKRRNITRLSWFICLTIGKICLIFLSAPQGCIVFSSLVCTAILINLLFTYIHPDFFSIDAYITVPILYSLAFIKIVLIPTDISANNMEKDSLISQSKYFDYFIPLNTTWQVVNYLSIILGTAILKFQTFYWRQGYPTFKQKMCGAFKQLLKQIAILVVIGGVIMVYLIIKIGVSRIKDILINLVNVMNLLYTFVFFIFLLGFGIVELPLYFITFTSSEDKLKQELQKLHLQHTDTQAAINVFQLDKKILEESCQEILKKVGHPSFEFCKLILNEMSEMKIELNDLFVKDGSTKALVKKPDSDTIYDEILSNIFAQVKDDYFLATKNFALFMRTFNSIALELDPFVPTDEKSNYSNKEISLIYVSINKYNKKDEENLSIIPKKYSLFINILTKFLGFLFSIMAIGIIIIQLSLVDSVRLNLFGYLLSIMKGKFYLTFFFVTFYIGFMFTCCYFAITQFKIAEGFLIVKHHSNKMGMASNARLCDTLLFGIIYNIVAFLGPIFFDTKDKVAYSTIEKFYVTMKDSGFMFTGYYYYYPALLVIVIVAYIAKKFSILCFKSKTAESYFTKSSFEDASEDNLQKIYKIIQKVEKIYAPLILEKAAKKKKNDQNSLTTQSSQSDDKSIEMKSTNSNDELIVKDSKDIIVKEKETSNVPIKEIAYMQGNLLFSTNEKIQSDKKYVKLTKTRITVSDSRDSIHKTDIILNEIISVTIVNKFILKVTTSINKVESNFYFNSPLVKEIDKSSEINQWKESIETYKKMSKK